MEGIGMAVFGRELTKTIEVWPTVSKVVSTIHTEEHYNRVVKLLDNLIDEIGKKEDPLLDSLIDTLGTLVKEYEDRTIPEPKGDAIGCLKFLMAEHGLKQCDLTELGSQGVVSEIINEKRKLNVRQIKELSKKFHCSPLVFMEDD